MRSFAIMCDKEVLFALKSTQWLLLLALFAALFTEAESIVPAKCKRKTNMRNAKRPNKEKQEEAGRPH